jgi:hypothetical protein
MAESVDLEAAFASARSIGEERALDESRTNLRIWRSVDVNIRLLLFCRRGATVSRRVHHCGVTFFLVGRIDGRCLLLACSEQPQHGQQVNRFFHITESYSTAIRLPRCRALKPRLYKTRIPQSAGLHAFMSEGVWHQPLNRSKWVFGITAPDRQQLQKEWARAFHSRSLVSSVGFWDASS